MLSSYMEEWPLELFTFIHVLTLYVHKESGHIHKHKNFITVNIYPIHGMMATQKNRWQRLV